MKNENPVRWFEIYVQDMPRAKKFYETVLGLTLSEIPAPEGLEIELWGFPMEKDKVGTGGALVRMPGFPSGGNSTLVYFGSPDCSIEVGRVTKAGGRIHKEKSSIGQYGFIALAYDTEGNMFGVHSME